MNEKDNAVKSNDIQTKGSLIVRILKIAVLLAVIAGLPLYLYFAVPDFWALLTDREAFKVFMTEHSKQGSGLYLLIQILQVVIGFIPGQVIQLVGGYVFGIGRGFLLSIIGTMAGTCIAFVFARHFGKELVRVFVKDEKLNKYIAAMDSGKGYAIVLIVFLIPGLPKDVFTYAAGLTRLKVIPYTLLSIVARAPAMLATILFAEFLGSQNYYGVAAVVAVIAILLLIVFFKRKKLFTAIDRIYAKVGEGAGKDGNRPAE